MNEPELSEEEIRQLQAELDRISVDDVLIQTVVTLLNVGARKSGLGDPTAPVDRDQTQLAIEGARALIPLLEERHGAQLGPIKDMVAQLQMAFAQAGEAPAEGAPEGQSPPEPPKPGAPGDAQSSGRLWVPGQ
jgi:hypothetical protein